MNTTTKHTPGPWTVDGLRVIRNGRQPTGLFNVANVSDPTRGPVRDGFSCERRANARLIAAAPDLLDLCDRALSVLNVDTHPDLCADLRAAIAKAGGLD